MGLLLHAQFTHLQPIISNTCSGQQQNKNWNFEFWFDEHYIMLIGSIINWLQKVWTFPSSYILISMKPNINDRCMKGLFGSHVKSILYWLEGQSISKNIYKKSQP